DLPAARIDVRSTRRRLQLEEREYAAESEIRHVRAARRAAVELVVLGTSARVSQTLLIDREHDQQLSATIGGRRENHRHPVLEPQVGGGETTDVPPKRVFRPLDVWANNGGVVPVFAKVRRDKHE